MKTAQMLDRRVYTGYCSIMQRHNPTASLEAGEHLRHKRLPQRLHFPAGDTVPESKRHLLLRTLLFQLLRYHYFDQACTGSDQFIYWNARDPRRSISPDVFLRKGTKDSVFPSWKTWERGAPELAIEIVSNSDAGEMAWEDKLERYHELGVQELVRFDLDATEGNRLRIWDRIDNDLVEREVKEDRSPVATLGLYWVVRPDVELGAVLRIAHDTEGEQLLLTAEEVEIQARQAAERRVAELEAELTKRSR